MVMSVMTEDMRRLRSEVEALRSARGALIQDLALGTQPRRNAVSRMKAGFRKTHRDMARNAKNARVAFATELTDGAMRMIEGFHKSHAEMAKRGRAERLAFVKSRAEMAKSGRAERLAFILDQKRSVAGLRQAVAADLAGARRSWFGSFATETPTRPKTADAKRQSARAEHKRPEEKNRRRAGGSRSRPGATP
jgi:hypothetical protein